MELFDQLTEEHIDFIKDQKVFFVATGVAEGTINLSPKGLDSLRVIENNTFFICFGCYMSRSRLMSSPYYQLGYEYPVFAYFY